jgi:CheY-like chemotaxis protein
MFERTNSHVLLIEDNPLDVDLIRHVLLKAETGITLDIARDGEESLSFVKTWEGNVPIPVLILLDLILPKIGGFEVLSSIKKHPRYHTIPVVVLTSSSNENDIHKALELGANSYVQKENDYDKFSQAVRLIHRYWCVLNVSPEKY